MTEEVLPVHDTGVSKDVLHELGTSLATVPETFNLHKGLKKILAGRRKAIEESFKLSEEDTTTQGLVDWPTAESLAWASLLKEGVHVRLSGQDVERGTFSQRHAVLHDQKNEGQYVPLDNLPETSKNADFHVCNSSLSEFGVLGFELGYSLVDPNTLVMWEAQFGDFCNTAQCIIDQFIASGERKWMQRSGLVMLLPHGYDGAGPEHSSARLERFLQLCDDHPQVIPPDLAGGKCRQIQDCNMQVVYCSTPANHFHALRRQIHRDFRKPVRKQFLWMTIHRMIDVTLFS